MAASKFGLADNFFSKDFVLFPDYNPEDHLEDDFDADVSALGEEGSPLDSGYVSGGNLESKSVEKSTVVDETNVSYADASESVRAGLSTLDIAALAKVNHDSIHKAGKNENTTAVEKESAHTLPATKSPKRAMSHDIEDPSPPTHSQLSDKITSPTPLQSWVQLDQADYRHELLAYRLSQPSKRRKTGAGRQ